MTPTDPTSPASPSTAVADVEPIKLEQCYLRCKPKIAAVPRDPKGFYFLDAVYAVSAAVGTYRRLAPMRPKFVQLIEFDVSHYDNLEDLAYALLYIQGNIVARSKSANDLAKTASDAEAHCDLMFLAALLHAKRVGGIDAAVITKLQEGSGRLDTLSDLTAMLKIFADLQGQTTNTALSCLELVDEARGFVQKLTEGLGAKGDPDEELDQLYEERRACAILLMKANDQMRRAMTYFRWDEGDANVVVASLREPSGSQTAKGSEEKKTEEAKKAEEAQKAEQAKRDAEAKKAAAAKKSDPLDPEPAPKRPFEDQND